MLRRSGAARRGAFVIGGIGLTTNLACYAYRPLIGPAPAIGARVRVLLTPEGVTDLTRYLGPRIAVAEGTLNAVHEDGAMVVGVDWVQAMDGGRQAWSGEQAVIIPKPDVAVVERRVLDQRRTAIAAVGFTGALVALAVTALKSGGASGSPGLERCD